MLSQGIYPELHGVKMQHKVSLRLGTLQEASLPMSGLGSEIAHSSFGDLLVPDNKFSSNFS